MSESSSPLRPKSRRHQAIPVCSVCKKSTNEFVLLPCCHCIICQTCISKKRRCPSCDHPIDKKNDEICQKHNKKFEYICETCDMLLCSDCIFEEFRSGSSPHKDHHVIKLEELTPEQLENEMEQVLKTVSKIDENCAQLEANMQSLTSARDDCLLDMFTSFKIINSHLESSYKEQEAKAQAQITELSSEMDGIKHLIDEAELVLTSNDNDTVMSATALLERLQNYQPPEIDFEPIHFVWENELIPPMQSDFYEIPDFAGQIRRAQQDKTYVLFSPMMKMWGMKWRLKIHPNGNADTPTFGTCMSVFVELLNGCKEGITCVYRIDIIHPDGHTAPISREFSSFFQNMDAWGWNKMATHQSINSGGYVGSDGALKLKFSIRPESYYDAAKVSDEELARVKERYRKLKEKKKLQANPLAEPSIDEIHTSAPPPPD